MSSVLVGGLNVASAQASTNVGGSINSDTTWTKANSPYNLTSNVLIKNGVTLTIQPGATVYLNNYAIKINGTIIARGTNTDRIYLISNVPALRNSDGVINFMAGSQNWSEQQQTGCIIENAIITSVQGVSAVYISASSPKISYCTITNTEAGDTIAIRSGSPLISNCTITNYNTDWFNTVTAISAYSGSNATISGNRIFGCLKGIALSGNGTIEKNLIYGNDNGIMLNSIGDIKIKSNTITTNSLGVYLDRYAFEANGSSLLVADNNFIDNEYNFESGGGDQYTPVQHIAVMNNWWQTTDAAAINFTINYYYNTQQHMNGTIIGSFTQFSFDFLPCLSVPSIIAPAIDYIPSPLEPTTSTAKWYFGSTVPSGNIGNSGDFYLNTNNYYVYTKTGNTWNAVVCIQGTQGAAGATGASGSNGATGATGQQGPQGPAGADGKDGKDGADGAVLYTGNTAPQSNNGNTGDFYVNTATGEIYSKTETGWTLQQTSTVNQQYSGLSETAIIIIIAGAIIITALFAVVVVVKTKAKKLA